MNRKRWTLLYAGTFVLLASTVFALNLSRVKTWSAEVLTHTDLNAEFDNVLGHEITNADISATAGIVGGKLDLAIPGAIGATTASTGAFSTLTISSDAAITGDLTASGSISFDEGVILPSGAVFYMITGSCPTGTTDVTSTYSNKFPRMNATPGSTGGADTHTHAAGSYAVSGTTSTKSNDYTSYGGGGGAPTFNATEAHSHTFSASVTGTSASGDNVPAYYTVVMCQVD